MYLLYNTNTNDGAGKTCAGKMLKLFLAPSIWDKQSHHKAYYVNPHVRM